VSVKAGVRMSLTAGCSDPRHLFPIAVHYVVSVSATLPLIVSVTPPPNDSPAVASDVAAAHQIRQG